ncbi:MAG: hypothetical protein IIY43_00075 [Oscillospiraceae bacterium]|nr:hypothetical protein [Oscillospiraceae bacterium]
MELDRKTLRPICEKHELIWGDPYRNGYERFGDDHCENPRTEDEIEALLQEHLRKNGLREDKLENHAMLRATFAGMPYIEGVWLTKHAGKYYLQYACPGERHAAFRKHLMHPVTVIVIPRVILGPGADKGQTFPPGQVFPKHQCDFISKMMRWKAAEQS